MPPPPIRSRTRRALNRRGVTTVAFGATSAVLLGMAALGTDVGLWYFSLRNARNAADAAAMAGAATAAVHDSTRGIAAAHAIASANGFTHATGGATVTVNLPPSSGAFAGTPGAVEVIIRQTQNRYVSRIVTGTDPALGVRAVAAPMSNGPACILALIGGTGLQIGGNATVASQGCILASNRVGSNSVQVFGSSTVSADTVRAVGDCNGCDRVQNTTSPPTSYGHPTSDPFATQVSAFTPPNTVFCGSAVTLNGSGASANIAPAAFSLNNPPSNVICSSIQVSNNQTLTLEPGVHVFWNAGLRINGGNVSCPNCTAGTNGVTLVFTGDNPNNIGTLRMDGNGTVNLFAGPNQAAPFQGILFYRDARAASDSGPNATTINGGSATRLSGGMYFPSSTVTYSGNMTGTLPCTALVALSITMSGNSSTTVNNTSCATYGTASAQTRLVRLVE